eukprot:5836410-Pleurochrysis_carterae.AAC.2
MFCVHSWHRILILLFTARTAFGQFGSQLVLRLRDWQTALTCVEWGRSAGLSDESQPKRSGDQQALLDVQGGEPSVGDEGGAEAPGRPGSDGLPQFTGGEGAAREGRRQADRGRQGRQGGGEAGSAAADELSHART